MMRAIYLAPIALVLSACQATAPQQKTAADDPSNPCFQSIEHNPSVQILKPRIGSLTNPDAASLDIRASALKPTEEEKSALRSWAELRQTCLDVGRQFRAQYAPAWYTSIIDESQSRFIINLSKLYAGQSTYGQFVNERTALAAETRARQSAANEGAKRSEQQAAAARQAQSSAELSNALMLMQLSQPRPAPMMPSMSCSSRNVGGTVYTDCR
jgi:hypothetical protein